MLTTVVERARTGMMNPLMPPIGFQDTKPMMVDGYRLFTHLSLPPRFYLDRYADH